MAEWLFLRRSDTEETLASSLAVGAVISVGRQTMCVCVCVCTWARITLRQWFSVIPVVQPCVRKGTVTITVEPMDVSRAPVGEIFMELQHVQLINASI